MLEGYFETIVRHIKTPKERLLSLGFAVGGLLGAILVFIVFVMIGLRIIGIVGGAVVLFFALQAIAFNKWEYEYIVTEGVVDIDQIIAQRKRKRMVSFDTRDCEIIAPLNRGNYFKEYSNLPRMEYTAYTEHEDNYFAVLERVGVKTCIIFQPTEDMLQMFKHYNRSVYVS